MTTTTLEQQMTEPERELLRVELGDQAPLLTLRSNTRVDTGRWWRRSRLWLCLTEHDILLFAAHKRHYIQRMPIRDCQSSRYCHTAGALLLEPREDWRFSTIMLPPTDAIRVLHHLENLLTQPSQPQQTKIPNPHVSEPTGD